MVTAVYELLKKAFDCLREIMLTAYLKVNVLLEYVNLLTVILEYLNLAIFC